MSSADKSVKEMQAKMMGETERERKPQHQISMISLSANFLQPIFCEVLN
jgi:hypothetical protein